MNYRLTMWKSDTNSLRLKHQIYSKARNKTKIIGMMYMLWITL